MGKQDQRCSACGGKTLDSSEKCPVGHSEWWIFPSSPDYPRRTCFTTEAQRAPRQTDETSYAQCQSPYLNHMSQLLILTGFLRVLCVSVVNNLGHSGKT